MNFEVNATPYQAISASKARSNSIFEQIALVIILPLLFLTMINNDEYVRINQQAQAILQNRRNLTNQQHEWNYTKQVGRTLQTQPFKYQSVQMSTKVQFTDEMRKLIYDQKNFPQDLKIFHSTDWQLAPVTESHLNPPTIIPSNIYIQHKKINAKQIQSFYGAFQHQGRIKGKANQINYNNYYYNLRSNALTCYTNQSVDAGEKQLFIILLNETTYDFRSDTGQYMLLKGQKNLKILRDQASRQLIRKLEAKLLKYAFRGVYALRNEAPNSKVQHYIEQEIDTIGPINFHQETAIKDITHMKYYRESVGGFLKLLQMNSVKRNNKAGQIYYPRWLKEEYRDMIIMETWLVTNVIPPQSPLMSLKIKVNDNQKESLFHSLKYIFPYRKNYLKRALVVYQSNLSDAEAIKVLNNLSYPMNFLGFPNNNLSVESLNFCIKKSSDFYNEVIDFSYNSKMTTIVGARSINLLNNNPTIKKLILKGCQVSNDDPEAFFDALASNLAIEQIVLDYSDAYNQSLVEFMEQFQAIIEDGKD